MKRNRSSKRAGLWRGCQTTAAVCEALEQKRLLTTVVPAWNSLPGAPMTLFLDFDGSPAFVWAGQNSNGTQILNYNVHGAGATNTPVPAFTIDANANDFSNTELDAMRRMWEAAAEKFSPFQINVTTVDPGALVDLQSARVLIGGNNSDWLNEPGSGRASIGSFTAGNMDNTCFAFSAGTVAFYGTTTEGVNNTVHFVGETIAHEAGHMFGLVHQRSGPAPNTIEYYDGDSQRSPVMGNSANSAATRGIWWKTNNWAGQNSPDPVRDELAQLASLLGYRNDDRGNSAGAAQPMSGTTGQVYGGGLIEQTTDSDWYSYTQIGSTATFTVTNATSGGMLAPTVELRDALGNLIAAGTTTNTSASVTATGLASGASYRVVVGSQGGYGDVGQYIVTGALDTFASYNGEGRTIVVTGYANQSDTISVYANYQQGKIVVQDGAAIQEWGVNFVDNVYVTLYDSGNDVINLYPIDPLGNPQLLVYGGGGTDVLNIYATGGSDTITVSDQSITVTESGNYIELRSYSSLEAINIEAGIGNDLINVESTQANAPLTIYGGPGVDEAIIGGTSTDISNVRDDVDFQGEDGADTFHVSNFAYAQQQSITYSFTLFNGFTTSLRPEAHLFSSAETWGIFGNDTPGSYNVSFLPAGTNVSIYTCTTNDTVTIGSGFQNVTAGTLGNLSIYGLSVPGDPGIDLIFDDRAGSADFVVGADAVSFTGTPGIVHYAAVGNITIHGSADANFFNVDGPNLVANVTINAGDGNDQINLAYYGNLAGVLGNTSLNGQGGFDTLAISNVSGTALSATISPAAFSYGSLTHGYSGFDVLSYAMSPGNDVTTVSGLGVQQANLYGNDGEDLLQMDVPATGSAWQQFSVAFDGGAFYDRVHVLDGGLSSSLAAEYAVVWSDVIRHGAGVDQFNVLSTNVDSLDIHAGAGNDSLRIEAANVPVALDGGAGDDVLSVYSSNINYNSFTSSSLSGGTGQDRLSFDDTGGAPSGLWQIDGSTIGRTNMPTFGYNTLESVTVTGNASDEAFVLRGNPAGCNMFILGQGGNDSYHVGGNAGFGGLLTVDGFFSLLQIQDVAGTNTLTVNDQSDSTGDSVRVEPYLIYNGPGTTFFGGPGGLLNFYGMSWVSLNLGSGADTIYVRPIATAGGYPLYIKANSPTAAPGDSLNLAFAAVTSPVFTPGGTGAGGYTFGNSSPINYTGIETTAIDSVAPTVVSKAFVFDAAKPSVDFVFSEDVSSLLNTAYLTLTNLTTGQQVHVSAMSLGYDPATNRARFTFPGLAQGLLADGNYRAELSAQVADLFGNWVGSAQTQEFFVLGGDANRDRVVDIADLGILATNWQGSDRTFSQGDFNYDGTIDITDLGILASNWQGELPASPPPAEGFAECINRIAGDVLDSEGNSSDESGKSGLPVAY